MLIERAAKMRRIRKLPIDHVNPTLLRSDMRYWRIDPDARLRPWIACYFVALPAPTPAPKEQWRAELLLPDGYSEIVFSLTAAFERWPVGASEKRATMRGSYVIGGRSHSVLTRNLGDLTIIGVKLESSALRRLIATPLSEFRDATLPLDALGQRALLDLEDALASSHSIECVRECLNEFFLARMSIFEPGDRLVGALLAQIRAARGSVPIMKWIDDQGADVRHFERRFCAWTGMTPKRYAQIMRFKYSYCQLVSALVSGKGRHGATGHHLAAYYDQSHFHRDFKYFMGVAPSARLNQVIRHGTDISEHLMQGELHAA